MLQTNVHSNLVYSQKPLVQKLIKLSELLNMIILLKLSKQLINFNFPLLFSFNHPLILTNDQNILSRIAHLIYEKIGQYYNWEE